MTSSYSKVVSHALVCTLTVGNDHLCCSIFITILTHPLEVRHNQLLFKSQIKLREHSWSEYGVNKTFNRISEKSSMRWWMKPVNTCDLKVGQSESLQWVSTHICTFVYRDVYLLNAYLSNSTELDMYKKRPVCVSHLIIPTLSTF